MTVVHFLHERLWAELGLIGRVFVVLWLVSVAIYVAAHLKRWASEIGFRLESWSRRRFVQWAFAELAFRVEGGTDAVIRVHSGRELFKEVQNGALSKLCEVCGHYLWWHAKDPNDYSMEAIAVPGRTGCHFHQEYETITLDGTAYYLMDTNWHGLLSPDHVTYQDQWRPNPHHAVVCPCRRTLADWGSELPELQAYLLAESAWSLVPKRQETCAWGGPG